MTTQPRPDRIVLTPAQRRSTRDRRGRGARGPQVVPRTPGVPEVRTARERFDDLVLGLVAEIDARWSAQLGLVEYAVEDVPVLPADWDEGKVPLASLVRGRGASPCRMVFFRRPLEQRSETRSDLEALVLTVVVEQFAELLDLPPEDVDPRYGE